MWRLEVQSQGVIGKAMLTLQTLERNPSLPLLASELPAILGVFGLWQHNCTLPPSHGLLPCVSCVSSNLSPPTITGFMAEDQYLTRSPGIVLYVPGLFGAILGSSLSWGEEAAGCSLHRDPSRAQDLTFNPRIISGNFLK